MANAAQVVVVATLATVGLVGMAGAAVFRRFRRAAGGGDGSGELPAPVMTASQAQWEREKGELDRKNAELAAKAQVLAAAGEARSEEASRLAQQLQTNSSAAMQAIESEKAAKEAEVQRRSEEEKARLARVGLDAEHFCNVGVVGTTGAGKTTLINCLRGLSEGDVGYARTSAGMVGTTETQVYGYPAIPFMMFCDVPGGDDQFNPPETYWTDHCLDVMDCLLVMFTTRITLVAKFIVEHALSQGRRFILVRTQSEASIDNIIRASRRRKTREQAIEQLRSEVRQEVVTKLGAAAAEKCRVLLIDSFAFLDGPVDGNPSALLDERELTAELLSAMAARFPQLPPLSAEELLRDM